MAKHKPPPQTACALGGPVGRVSKPAAPPGPVSSRGGALLESAVHRPLQLCIGVCLPWVLWGCLGVFRTESTGGPGMAGVNPNPLTLNPIQPTPSARCTREGLCERPVNDPL